METADDMKESKKTWILPNQTQELNQRRKSAQEEKTGQQSGQAQYRSKTVSTEDSDRQSSNHMTPGTIRVCHTIERSIQPQ
jgi:hypothetical protein